MSVTALPFPDSDQPDEANLFGPEPAASIDEPDVDVAKLLESDPQAFTRAPGTGLRVDVDAFIAKAGERRFKILDVEAQDRMPDPRWLIDGWLPAEGLSVIYAPPSAAKSFFKISMMLSVVTGVPFFGIPVNETGPVLYLAGEGAAGIKLRRQAWQQFHGKTNADLAGFYLMGESAQLRSERDVSALLLAINSLPEMPKVIVVDTLHRYYDGDENSSMEMGEFIRACELLEKATGAMIDIVHHSNASGGKERGSTSLRGDVNFTIRIDHEEMSPVRTAQVVKVKDGKTPTPITFQLEDIASSAVPVRAGNDAGYTPNVVRPDVPGLVGSFGGGRSAANPQSWQF